MELPKAYEHQGEGLDVKTFFRSLSLAGQRALLLAGFFVLCASSFVLWIGHGFFRYLMTENLIFAAGDADPGGVRRALALGANVNGRFESGTTALEMAIVNRENDFDRRLETVRVLLDAGADPNLPTAHGSPPLLQTDEPAMIHLLKSRGATDRQRRESWALPGRYF